jgi:hypothetical protein
MSLSSIVEVYLYDIRDALEQAHLITQTSLHPASNIPPNTFKEASTLPALLFRPRGNIQIHKPRPRNRQVHLRIIENLLRRRYHDR